MSTCPPPKKVLARVAKDIQKLVKEKIEGIQMDIDDDLTDIRARIDGPQGTPYENGVFNVRLVLSHDFPTTPPKGFFLTKVFHPNVNIETGEICVDTLKRDWNPNLGIRHVLLVIRCLLIHPNPESALNEEAGKLLLHERDYPEFAQRAQIFTQIYAQSAPGDTKDPPQRITHKSRSHTLNSSRERPTLEIKGSESRALKEKPPDNKKPLKAELLAVNKDKKKKRVKRSARKRQRRSAMDSMLDRL